MPISAASATKAGLHSPDGGAVLLVGAAVLLLVGAGALIALRRSRRAAPSEAPIPADLRLAALMLASLPAEIREYLSESSPAPGLSNTPDVSSVVDRLAFISIDQPPRRATDVGLHDLAIGLAVLEAKVGRVGDDISRIEQNAISIDRLVWTVLGVTGAVVAILGGIVAIVAGLAQVVR